MTLTEEEAKSAEKLFMYFFLMKDNMLSMFFNTTLPGLKVDDYLGALVPLLTTSNPEATIQNMAIEVINKFCNNFNTTPAILCEPGYIWDELSGFCLISLNGTQNYWQAIEDCIQLGADLVGFDNNLQVKGILKLLNSGNCVIFFIVLLIKRYFEYCLKKSLLFTDIGSLTVSQDSKKTFFINAFGNPDDGYSFQESAFITNMSNFQSITLVNQHFENQFCLKANADKNLSVLTVQSTVCYAKIGAICRKGPKTLPNCSETSLKPKTILDIMSDQVLTNQLNLASKYLETNYRRMFQRINKTSGFEGMFSILWYSGLPCFDINGVTSTKDGEKSVLKSCFWKGVKIPCAAIFSTFPTDQGMCCAFNMKAADEMFQQATYAELLMKKQAADKMSSFMDFNVPSWYAMKGEPKIQPGINKGLTLMLDSHNDIVASGSVDSDFQGFTAIVTNRDSYPLTRQQGFQLKSGHFNLVGLSGTKISATHSIQCRNLETFFKVSYNCL